MKVFFRTDASVLIGTGHVMRCLSLARELAAGGAAVEFICRPHEGHMSDYVRNQEGFPVHLLPETPASGPDGEARTAHADWLSTDWRTDVRQTASAIRTTTGGGDWLVVDHYALDYRWEKAMRPAGAKILVIDDLADRAHDCDVIVDHNLYPALESRYDALVPSGCGKLLGPRYAMLRREFRETRERMAPRPGTLRRALVFFGGADPTNETGKALEAWNILGRSDLALDVVVGGANPHRESIREACARHPALTFHFQARNMAELMANADLAIGAGGTATWERCCVSLPALCVTIADNQKLLVRTAHDLGYLMNLGHHDSIGPGDIALALGEFMRNPGWLRESARRAGEAVDGLGASRVAAFMTGAESALRAGMAGSSGTSSTLRLRPAAPEDMSVYFRWANDPIVRGSAFSQDPIPFETHEKWFSKKLIDPGAGLYVLECGGVPAGQIRFDRSADDVEIDFSVAHEYRGRGLGVELLRLGTDEFRRGATGPVNFLGVVKQENAASAKVFLAAGFDQMDSMSIGGKPCLVFRKTVYGR